MSSASAPIPARGDAVRSVEFLYRVLLGREPDPAGLALYANQLATGQKDAPTLALAFIASGEFRRRRADAIAHAGYDRVEALGCVFLTPEGGEVTAELAAPDGYEPWVLPYFLELCRPGMTVLDIGASIGAFALPAAKRVAPNGVVYAVEVSPQNCRLLAQSIALNGLDNVRLLPLGASDHLGFGQLQRQVMTNNNVLEADSGTLAGDVQNHDVVPVLPLDLLHGVIGKVDLVKLDIEGMEYRAVMGALTLLRADLPTVFLEYSPSFQLHLSKVPGARLLEVFIELGYSFEILHRTLVRERVPPEDAVKAINAAWKAHVDQGGTHLDLCLHPPAAQPG